MKGKLIKTMLVLMLSVLCMQIDAQTVIRERVKIKPSPTNLLRLSKTAERFLPCKPWPQNPDSITSVQVVWAGNIYPIDPGQQPQWYQSDSLKLYTNPEMIYDIDVVEGDTLIEFHKYTPIYDEYGDITDAEDSLVSPHLKHVFGVEIRGEGSNWTQSCDYDYNITFHKYLMKFKPGQSGAVKIRYKFGYDDSLFVKTYVVNPTYHLSYAGQVDSTYHNYEFHFAPGFELNECSGGCTPMQTVNEYCYYELLAGSEYGILFNKQTKEAGDYLMATPGEICFVANGKNPTKEGLVTVRVTPYITQAVGVSFKVLHYEGITPGLNVSFSKTDLAAGDTVDVVIKKYYESSWTESGFEEGEFNWGTTFEVGIQEGCEIGEILTADGRRGTYFRDLQLPIKFVVGQSISADSALLKIRVAADEPKGQATKLVGGNNSKGENSSINFSMKSFKKNARVTKTESSCTTEEFYLSNYRVAEATEVVHTILLGETKYYGLKKKQAPEKTEYKIEEIPTPYGVAPSFPALTDGWTWEESDVWGDNPVSKISGTETVVYWEKKCPNGNSLLPGIIRIIGRYWVSSIMQKVKLTDKDNRVSLQLAVKRPGKLGATNFTMNDVFNNEVKIDDLCCEMGGSKGIPPQIIKGQIEQETDFRNSYRYEPFQDTYYQNDKYWKRKMFDTYNYFTVIKTSMGNVNIPTHLNVSPFSYPSSPVTIGSYLKDMVDQYVQTKSNGFAEVLDRYGNKTDLDKHFQKYFENGIDTAKKYIGKNFTLENKKHRRYAASVATDSLKLYLTPITVSGFEMIAQTRIIASYGILQQTFYDAVYKELLDWKYSNSQRPPELLNEIDYAKRTYIQRISGKLINRVHNNWTEGYEEGWKNILHDYNGNNSYQEGVLSKSKKYIPVN